MEKLTYKQAFDKITEAYIKGEIEPYNRQFCFCGTLAYEKKQNFWDNDWNYSIYSHNDLFRMEHALLNTIKEEMKQFFPSMNKFAEDLQGEFPLHSNAYRSRLANHPNFENALFAGMCAALEVLKQIHKERGEDAEDLQFTKRSLLTIK